VVRKLSNQVHTQSLYDPQGRLIGQVNRRENSNEFAPELPTVSRRRYCYNPRNQLVRIDDQGHGTSLYQYDLLDRLRTVEGPTPEAFLFDPASNLLEALDGQEATDAQASQALPEPSSPNARRPQQTPGNRLKRQRNRRFTYDERGNRTEEIVECGARQGQVTRYRYNAQNQLVEVNVAGVVTRYAYDALGRRISKTSESGNTCFYWNGDVLLGEVNEGANNTKPSRTYLFEPFSFKPLALIQNNEVFHYHTDHIGTPREITNARAQVVWSASFKTYGALALAHVNEVDNPLRFQGQYFDCETRLHYNRHRYYDPECGQFTTQDPIGLLGGMNAYQYAPNPMTWVDPWGLKGEEKTEVLALPAPRSSEPWMPGAPLVSEPAPKGGLVVEMAMAPGQTSPGGWATTDHIPDVNYVRNELAVTPEFKSEVGTVQKFLIPEGVQIQRGTVGPQVFDGQIYPGGGGQIQILNYSDRGKLIPIGEPRAIY
jgi:RHS repeat-associated protein